MARDKGAAVILPSQRPSNTLNETTAIPELLGMLDLSAATVTIDAMGCQKKIAESIVDARLTTC